MKARSSLPLGSPPAAGLSRPVTPPAELADAPARLFDADAQAHKRESLEQLAGRLAHDFNDHLVGMLTAADLLCRDLAPGSEEHGLAELIRRSADRAAQLTRQLQTYAGRAPLCPQPLDINFLVAESLAGQTATLPRHLTLVSMPADRLPATRGDPGQVRQIITELVANAAEALGPRPGHILVATGVEELADEVLDAPGTRVLVSASSALPGGGCPIRLCGGGGQRPGHDPDCAAPRL